MPSDGVNLEVKIAVAKSGIMDGLDPAQPDYPDSFAPDLENFRVTGGLWATRLGSSVFKTLPGSGDVRYYADHYEPSKRVRLAFQGNTTAAALYDYVEGSDSQFQTTTGGTGMGGSVQPYFHGCSLNSRFYYTDRFGALRKYQETPTSGNQVRSVALPTAPAAAPTLVPRTYYTLTKWDAAEIAAWSITDNTKFDLALSTTTDPSPMDGDSAKLSIVTTSGRGQSIRRFGSQLSDLGSHTMAFFFKQASSKQLLQYDIGLNTVGDFTQLMQPSATDDWQPFFMPIGDLPQIFFREFKCSRSPSAQDIYVSNIYLPGKLEGKYRWVYTHYDSVTGRESAPSPRSGSGVPADFSTIGVTGHNETARAFTKSCGIIPTTDSGTDSTTNKVRVYRNGGVPSLTVDSRNLEVWCRVGEVNDLSGTTSQARAIGDTSVTMSANPSTAGFVAGDWICFEPGTPGSQDIVQITGVTATTIQFTRTPLKIAHLSGVTVQVIFLDNVANEEVNPLTRIFLERNDPPSASLFVSKAPDGRLWLFGPNSTISVSNKPTPERPEDYEVFPSSVDPLTRSDAVQGWTFEVNGDVSDERIVWGGFFQGYAHVLTNRNLYRINALSQKDWGPNAVERLFSVGCIAGDTVAEVGGVLYWAADGPRIMRWSGQGPPESISHLRINARLNSAPTAYWNLWFARYHASQEGHYYRLYYVPSGSTTPTERLDWNADNEAWERSTYRNSAGTKLAFRGASVRDAGSDVYELYQVDTAGIVYQAETGSTDNSVAITVALSTKKFPLGYTSRATECYLRGAAATDSLTLTVATGGSEYGDVSHSYAESLAGTGDLEIKQRLHRDLKGRWVQAQISGSVSNRPAIREIDLEVVPIRLGRESA